ncbi:MAG: hypothetical protein OXC01_17185 [Immundisolibacterales bacterium]|nr:hypothetical protein [Immundisolibacterales bacterium]
MFKNGSGTDPAARAPIDMLDGCQHRGPVSTGFALYGDALDGELRLRFKVFAAGDGTFGTGALGGVWPELRAAPDLPLARDIVATPRRLKIEEIIDIAWLGGARSGTNVAEFVGLGMNAIGYGVAVTLALGGYHSRRHALRAGPQRGGLRQRGREHPRGQRGRSNR